MSAAERAALIAALARLPAQLEALVAGLSPEELTAPFLAGEWTVAQNVHHLYDSHANSYIRCKLILSEERPPLKPYDQDAWAALPDATGPDLEPSLAGLRALHARWVRFWETLPPDAWAREGLHPENGPMSLDRILAAYAAHGEAHLDQITRTLAARE
jgi:uncharacterized damage-inducible protein DinB